MLFVIWSAEHNAWWRPDHNGYTSSLKDAGRYERDEAARIVRNANVPLPERGFLFVNEVMIPVDLVGQA